MNLRMVEGSGTAAVSTIEMERLMHADKSLGFRIQFAGLLIFCALLLMQATPVCAGAVVETNDVLTFEYQQTGANEEEAVRLACIRAVNATVGRLLFSDYSLQARELLTPYIQKNWQRFVASYYVLERRFERDGFGTRIRVQTFPEALHRDLRQKRFLYEPRPNPYHYVFMAQTVNGQLGGSDLARRITIDALVSEGYKVYETGIQTPAFTSDVMADAVLFSAAREASLRIGAEVIIAGRAVTQSVRKEEIYYATIETYETQVHLDMIRADDGTLLGSADAVERASDADPNLARDQSIQGASETAMGKLLESTRGVWRAIILDRPKFSLMFTDLTPNEVELVVRHLESYLRFGTRARLRSYYGGVAIVNVDTERDYSVLQRALQEFRSFDLRVTDRQGRRVTVDTKH